MLEREQQEALHGRPPPRPVPAPAPFQPEVLPPARTIPEVLPPVRRAEVLLPVKRAPEVLPPARTAPKVLPPRRETPQVLPPVRRQAEVSPPEPVVTAMIAAPAKEEHPGESAATWSAVEDLLEQQRQQTRAHERARAAARELSGRARSRASHQPPAQPNRIQRLAGWLLNCAHRVLEHLGMKPEQVIEERQTPERVAAMEGELRRRAKWFHNEDSVPWVLYDATRDITGKTRDWKTTSLEEQTRILDRADLLSMSGWMVGRAQVVSKAVSPVTLARETIWAAAQEIAGDPKLNNWQRTLAAGLASGQVSTHFDTGLGSVDYEEQQTTDHLMKAKREAAANEARRQTAEALKEWNATKWFRGPEPKPVAPAKPAPPTPDEIRDFRQEVFGTIKEAMQKDVLEKFSEPIRDVVDRAFERGEQPVSRPSPPRTKTRGPDPGRTM